MQVRLLNVCMYMSGDDWTIYESTPWIKRESTCSRHYRFPPRGKIIYIWRNKLVRREESGLGNGTMAHLLVVHEPAVEVLALPELDLLGLRHIDVMAKRQQARLVVLPAEVQLWCHRPVVEWEVYEVAALGHQRHQETCSIVAHTN